jgi:hypothetical protein
MKCDLFHESQSIGLEVILCLDKLRRRDQNTETAHGGTDYCCTQGCPYGPLRSSVLSQARHFWAPRFTSGQPNMLGWKSKMTTETNDSGQARDNQALNAVTAKTGSCASK